MRLLAQRFKKDPANLSLLYIYEIIRGSRTQLLATSKYLYIRESKDKKILRNDFRVFWAKEDCITYDRYAL